MAILDLQTMLPFVDEPKGGLNGGVIFDTAGESLILCVPKTVTAVQFLTTNPLDVSVERSMSPCEIDMRNGCCVPIEIDNPDAIWTTCGNNEETPQRLNVAGFKAIRVTANAPTTLQMVAFTDTQFSGCWECTTTLCDLVEAITEQPNIDFEPVMFTDCEDKSIVYFQTFTVDEITGAQTVQWLDADGNPIAKPANVCPVLPSKVKWYHDCLEVVTAGAWGAVGDNLTKSTCINTDATPPTVSVVYVNNSTDAVVVVPTTGSVRPCANLSVTIETDVFCDHIEGQLPVRFFQRYTLDPTTGLKNIIGNFDINDAPYVIVGTVDVCGEKSCCECYSN